MRRNELILVFTVAMSLVAPSFTASELNERVDDLCKERVALFERDLAKVVKPSNYSVKKRFAVRAALSANFPEKDGYKSAVIELRELSQGDEIGDSMRWMTCLFKANELVKKLDKIAKEGGKDLNSFSKHWRHSFFGQAKRLGYQF